MIHPLKVIVDLREEIQDYVGTIDPDDWMNSKMGGGCPEVLAYDAGLAAEIIMSDPDWKDRVISDHAANAEETVVTPTGNSDMYFNQVVECVLAGCKRATDINQDVKIKDVEFKDCALHIILHDAPDEDDEE